MTPVDMAEKVPTDREHPFRALDAEEAAEQTGQLPTIDDLEWNPYA